MTRFERVAAAFRGEAVDRVPISFWQHFPGRDHEAELLAAATVDYQHRFDLDFVKLTPTGMYSVVDYGVAIRPSDDDIGTTRFVGGPVHQPGDWKRLPSVSPHRGALGEQIKVVQFVRGALGPAVPILETIFSPLTMAVKIAGGNLSLVVDEPAAAEWALDRLANDVIAFGHACLEAGADGFFFATQQATSAAFSSAGYERFGVVYDLRVLNALRPHSWGLILHLHGLNPLFDLPDRYPIDGVSWHARETAPSLEAALTKTKRGLVGGIARMGPAVTGSPHDVGEEVQEAITQTSGRRLIVAPSCVIPATAPDRNLKAARRAVDS